MSDRGKRDWSLAFILGLSLFVAAINAWQAIWMVAYKEAARAAEEERSIRDVEWKERWDASMRIRNAILEEIAIRVGVPRDRVDALRGLDPAEEQQQWTRE